MPLLTKGGFLLSVGGLLSESPACCCHGGGGGHGPGACCTVTGGCSILNELDCFNAGGFYQGEGSACGGSTCVGACCHEDHTCVPNQTQTACTEAAGTFTDYGEDCSPNPCTDCISGSCTLSVILTDINCCEDDIFEVFLSGTDIGSINMISSPPGCCLDCPGCPQTSHSLSGVVTNENSPGCTGTVTLNQTGSNCCGTFMEVKVSGPGGTRRIELSSAGTQGFYLGDLCGV